MKRTSFVCLSLIAILFGCSTNFTEHTYLYIENSEIIGEEKENLLKNLSPTIWDEIDRSNKYAKELIAEVKKPNSEFKVSPGRYIISGTLAGNITVYDQDRKILLDETIGIINTVTLDLNENHIIVADGGFESIMIEPVSTEIQTTLTTGIWDVGLDVEPGTYSFKAGWGTGYIIVLDRKEEPKVYDVIGNFTESKIELKSGQKVIITEIDRVDIEKVN